MARCPTFVTGLPKSGRSRGDRAKFEAAWKVKMPTTKGLDNHQMIDAIHDGKLKAMYLFGEEISLVDSNANHVRDGLSPNWNFLSRRIFSSAIRAGLRMWFSRRVPSLEKEGTFTSTERRIQRLYQVLEPLEGSRPDWRIIQDVANRLGARLGLSNIPRSFIARSQR